MADLSEQSLKSLQFRQQMGREILRLLRTKWRGEEGAAEAQARYEEQLEQITDEIRRRKRAAREARGEDKPPDQVIEMKVARMGAAPPRRDGVLNVKDVLAEARRVLAAAHADHPREGKDDG